MDSVVPPANGRVLLVKISAMGDVIHTFPFLAALKNARPDLTVDWVVGDPYVDLARLSPHTGALLPFRRAAWSRWWRPATLTDMGRFRRELVDASYDVVIDLQGLLRSALVSRLANVPTRIGFANAREGAPLFYTHTVPVPDPNVMAVDRYLSVLPTLGVGVPDEPTWDLLLPDGDQEEARRLTPDGPYAVINPNTRWETKRWGEEHFAAVARLLRDRRHLPSVIVGSPAEKERGERIVALSNGAATNLSGAGGFGLLAAIIAGGVGMITNDSGPMHLAVAVGAPVVALFGPTNAARTGPYGGGHQVVTVDCDQTPCYRRSCPKGVVCLDTLSPETVADAWGRLVGKG